MQPTFLLWARRAIWLFWTIGMLTKIVVPIAIAVIVSMHLHNATVDGHDAEDRAETVEYTCLLGWGTFHPASLCVYGYVAAGSSLLTSIFIMILMVLIYGRFRSPMLYESAFAFIGMSWWAIAGGIFTHYPNRADQVDLPSLYWRHAIVILSWCLTAVNVARFIIFLAAAWYLKQAPVSRFFVDALGRPQTLTVAMAEEDNNLSTFLRCDPTTDTVKYKQTHVALSKAVRNRLGSTNSLRCDDPNTAPALYASKLLFPTSSASTAASDMDDLCRGACNALQVNLWKRRNGGLLMGFKDCLAGAAVPGVVAGGLTWVWLVRPLDETYSMDVVLVSSAVGVAVLTATAAFGAWGRHGQAEAEIKEKLDALVVSLRGKLSLDKPIEGEWTSSVDNERDTFRGDEEGTFVYDVLKMGRAIKRWYKEMPKVAARLCELEARFPRMGYITGDGNCAYRAGVTAMLEGLVVDAGKVNRLVKLLLGFSESSACDAEAKSACIALCTMLAMTRHLSAHDGVSAARNMLNDSSCASEIVWLARKMVAHELRTHVHFYIGFINDDTDEGMAIETICSEEVLVRGTSGDELQLAALARAWGPDVVLGVVDVAADSTAESRLGSDSTSSAAPIAWLLHTPNHWGVIYAGGAETQLHQQEASVEGGGMFGEESAEQK